MILLDAGGNADGLGIDRICQHQI